MSSSNTSPLDQNVFDPQVAAEQREQRKEKSKVLWQSATAKKRRSVLLAFSAVVIGFICCLAVW